MGSRAYGQGRFDSDTAMAWLKQNVKNNDVLLIRTSNAALICISTHDFLCPKRKYAYIPVIVGMDHVWEAIKLARVAIAWAKTRGAKRFMLGSDDDVPDIGPIAKRLGMVPMVGMYEVDLDG